MFLKALELLPQGGIKKARANALESRQRHGILSKFAEAFWYRRGSAVGDFFRELADFMIDLENAKRTTWPRATVLTNGPQHASEQQYCGKSADNQLQKLHDKEIQGGRS